MCFCSAEGHSGDGYYLHRFSLDYNGACVCFQLCQGMTSCFEESCFVGCYSVCNFVVFSAVEVFAHYGGVYVFHVCSWS